MGDALTSGPVVFDSGGVDRRVELGTRMSEPLPLDEKGMRKGQSFVLDDPKTVVCQPVLPEKSRLWPITVPSVLQILTEESKIV